MGVISEPKCPQFLKKCPHAPRVPRAAFSSSEEEASASNAYFEANDEYTFEYTYRPQF
jgi:hypothetical protein